MTKNEYAKTHGLRVRKPTKEEREHATKNGATAQYVIDTPSGHSYWSKSGTMDDLRRANNASKAAVKQDCQINKPKTVAKPSGKTAQSKKKTTTKRK